MARRSGHGPGYAALSVVATHWRVSPETARKLIRAVGIRTIRRRGRRYVAWRDVWALEGANEVPEHLWSAYQAPLFDRTDLAAHYGLSERTARRWLEHGTVPAIRLSDRIVRVRPIDVDGDEFAEAA